MPLSSGLHQFLPRMPGTGSVAPDHPVKQMQAWNQINHSQMDQMHSQLTLGRPTQLPEDVTALADRDNYNNTKEVGTSKENGKNPVTKTYHTIKDIISAKFKKDQVTTGSLDELNNATTFQQQVVQQRISPYSIKKPHPIEMQSQFNGHVTRPNTDSPIYLQSSHINQQLINAQIQSQYQKAASQPHLNFNYDTSTLHNQLPNQSMYPMPTERRGSIDNVEVTDSDDGGFISKERRSHAMLSSVGGHETPVSYMSPGTQSYYEKQKTPHFSGYRPQSTLDHINERKGMYEGQENGRDSRPNLSENIKKPATPINNNSSDYEKGENPSSNVDSGRESLAYTPGSRSHNHSKQNGNVDQSGGENDSEWVNSALL